MARRGMAWRLGRRLGMGMGRLGLLRLGSRLGMGLWLGIWLEPILGLATLLVQPMALRLFRLHLPEPVAERAKRRPRLERAAA
jgi:hypothetical protein